MNCPHCNSPKTVKVSQTRSRLGFALIIIGLLTIPFLVGLPLLFFGAILFVSSVFTKDKKRLCKDCNKPFDLE